MSLAAAAALYVSWAIVSAATPQVAFERNDDDSDPQTPDVVTVTVTPGSGDELKFLHNGSNDQYWDYGVVDAAADCKAGTFTDSGDAVRTGATDNSVSFTHQTPDNDEYLCVKVLYGRTNSQRFSEHYAAFLYDVTPPEITVEQAATTLRAQSNDPSGIATWSHSSTGSDLSDADCEGESYGDDDTSGNNQRSLTLTSADNDNWYCFRAVDGQGNTGYSDPIEIDAVAPELSIAQNADSALVTVSVSQDDDDDNTPDGNDDIDVDSWQYLQTTRTCDSRLTGWRDLDGLTDDLTRDRAAITFSKRATNKTYCFRVADEAGNYAYAAHQVGSINEPPVINSLVQSRQSVIAQATDAQYLNANSWQYAATTSETCNDGAASNWQGLSSNGFSVNDRGHATVDLTTVTIDESAQDKWLCFRVADNIVSNYGYRSINVDATAPVVNVNQNGASLTASAPSSDGAVSSSWSYVRHTSSFACDEDAFDIYTPIRRGRSVNLVSADVGDYFCFRVADRYNNYGFGNVYEVRSLDTTAPTLQAVQSNKYLRVSAPNVSDIDDSTWGYEDGFASQQDCDEVASRHYRDIEDKTIVLGERDVGDWFCIRAADKSGNYGYLSVRIKAVDASAPFVSVDRERNSLTAETDAGDVDRASWQYAVSAANDRFDCEEANTNLVFNAASADNYRVALSESDEDKYYCFRVADKSGNYGYGRSEKIANVEVAPVITVVQITGQGRLEVSTDAVDVDGLTWGWAVFASDPGDCADVSYTDVTGAGVTTTTRRIIVSDIADTQDGSYYCFRVADTSTTYGYNYGYAKHRYDLGAPTISFSLSADNVLTVSSSATDIDATSWRYARFAAAPDCAAASINRTLPAGNKFALTAADNGSWFCFRVSDTSSNVGYARYEVSGITADAAPTINVTQTKLVVIATSADADLNGSSWRYAFSTDEPFCGPGSNLVFIYNQSSPNRVNLAGLGSSHNWVCFRVADTAGNAGYAKLQLDRQAPTIKIVQSGTELTVEGTDADLNARSWSYAKSDSDMACDASASFTKLNFNSVKISFDLTAADSGKTFCFRVADRIGNHGYEKIQIDPVSLSAPVVTIEQSGAELAVSANNVDDSSWQYVRSGSDVNCSGIDALSFNAASAGNKQVSLTTADNGKWFCFRVRGNNGAYGYAKVLVDNVADPTAPVERPTTPTTPTTPGTTPTTPVTAPTAPVDDAGAGEVEVEIPEEAEVDEGEEKAEEDEDGAGEVTPEEDEDEVNWWPVIGIIAGAALVLTIIIVAVVSPSRKNDDDLPGDYV